MGFLFASRLGWRILARVVLATLLLAGCREARKTTLSRKEAERRPAVEEDDRSRPSRPLGTRPRVILIGLDGADWSLLDPLRAKGTMPNLDRLVREGATASLTSFIPMLSPIVWTSIATGVAPQIHGVLDFQEVEPATGKTSPISGRSRRVPAVWNTASAEGLRVGVVGWWATHPAEEVSSFFVSDRLSSILFEGSKESMTYPPSLEEGVRRINEREGEIPNADLLSYFAMSAEELTVQRGRGGGLENPVIAMAKILGATRAVQRVARELYDRERPDLTAVYFEGTDAVGHVFASYVPPRLSCVSEEEFRRYSGTVETYYGMVDRLLGQWMRRAREDGATLLICSDHGFKWGEDRTCQRSSLNWATAAFWHRLDGVLVVWGGAGGRVHASPTRGEASVYDIAPTICALLRLPMDRLMAGKPLLPLFRDVAPPVRRDVYSKAVARRLSASAPAAAERDDYARKLRALGYLSGSESKSLPPVPEGAWPGRTEGAWNNLGLYQRETGELEAAERSFREALRLNPEYASPMFNLAVLERTRGRWRAAVDWLFRSLAAGHAEPEQTLLQWATYAVEARRRAHAVSLLERGAERYPTSEEVARALARLRFEGKDCRGAVSALRRFAEAGGRDTLNILGVSELCLGHREDARRYMERSLALDPKQPPIEEALRLMRAGP